MLGIYFISRIILKFLSLGVQISDAILIFHGEILPFPFVIFLAILAQIEPKPTRALSLSPLLLISRHFSSSLSLYQVLLSFSLSLSASIPQAQPLAHSRAAQPPSAAALPSQCRASQAQTPTSPALHKCDAIVPLRGRREPALLGLPSPAQARPARARSVDAGPAQPELRLVETPPRAARATPATPAPLRPAPSPSPLAAPWSPPGSSRAPPCIELLLPVAGEVDVSLSRRHCSSLCSTEPTPR